MIRIPTYLLLLLPFTVSANIHHIDLAKLNASSNVTKELRFLNENERYFDHWSAEWNYTVTRASLVKGLKNVYRVFKPKAEGNLEQHLLMGDVSFYLYNLNEQDYFEIAENQYQKAIDLAPTNFKPHWFMANLYANANLPDKAIAQYRLAQKYLPVKTPALFWEQLAFATAAANMPSSCIRAMDQANSILGHPSTFERSLGVHIRSLIRPIQRDSSYSNRDIWSYQEGVRMTFVSRPLGMRMAVKPHWQLDLGDYANGKAGFSIVPDTAKSRKGTQITYTLAGIMKVTNQDDDLNTYVNSLLMDVTDKKRIHFSDKYPDMIAWEIKDKEMYESVGGAHMYLVGIKRPMPEYPGLLLEQPVLLDHSNSGELEYFRASGSRNRFGGVIFYAFILDACEDVFKEADAFFRDFMENQLVLE